MIGENDNINPPTNVCGEVRVYNNTSSTTTVVPEPHDMNTAVSPMECTETMAPIVSPETTHDIGRVLNAILESSIRQEKLLGICVLDF